MKPIFYGRQDISEADIEAVIATLRSDFLTQGPEVPRFERALEEYCGAPHAVVTSSATAALQIGCAALGVGPGSRVWTSANTFSASSNCALYLGADIDFVDIEPDTYNLSVSALELKLEMAEREGSLPHLLIPVHHSGQSCDMRRIRELSLRYGFKVLEDASHAIGGSYLGNKIGSCQYSDLAVFSFHPVKIITTGEGGAIVTRDPELHRRAALLVTHGITRDPARLVNPSRGPWYYEQLELGWNYRMTDFQAALGLSQLKRIDHYVSRRNEITRFYRRELQGLPLRLPRLLEGNHSSDHLFVVRLQLDQVGMTHRQVFDELHSRGIMVNLHYIPVYLHPYYAKLGFGLGHCPEAERYYAEAMTLPLYPRLTDEELARVVQTMREVLVKAPRP